MHYKNAKQLCMENPKRSLKEMQRLTPKALAIAGAFYFFDNCLIIPKYHSISGTK